MLHLNINPTEGVPLYLQLVQQIKAQIASGRLQPDAELPPVRVLAQQLVLNPNTIVRAYRELEVAGLVYKRRGAGTYIADQVTPYTDAECRRMLTERADALAVEAQNLGYSEIDTIALLRARIRALKPNAVKKKGA